MSILIHCLVSYPRFGQLHPLIPTEVAVQNFFGPPVFVQPHIFAATQAPLEHSVHFQRLFHPSTSQTPRMAADSKTVNGSYGAQYPYGQAESFVPSQGLNASNGNTPAGIPGEDAAATAAPTSSEPAGAGEASKAPSKDEVGWYFVESYYTTLSKNPETLYVRHCMVLAYETLYSLQVSSCTTTNGLSLFQVLKRRKLTSRLASGYEFLFARGTTMITDFTCRLSMTV